MLNYDTLDLLTTDDGSITLARASDALSLRSTRGAATESRHVFIDGSEVTSGEGEWAILELGLGTGMNFCQSVAAFLSSEARSLIYHAVEESPLPLETLEALAGRAPAPLQSGYEILRRAITQSRQSPKEAPVTVSTPAGVHFTLHPRPWQRGPVPNLAVDACFHDPFAPAENPECWTAECFRWARTHLHPSGRLVTYGASSEARKAMADAGLFVAKREGACGKREMTVAARSRSALRANKLLPEAKQPRETTSP